MHEAHQVLHGSNISSGDPEVRLSRRSLLKTFVAANAVLVGGSVLSACGSSGTGSPTVTNATLTTNGWPFDVMPDKATRAKDPAKDAYAQALDAWLKQNPGVKVQRSSVDIWTSQVITTAVSAGTAPTVYSGASLGNYVDAATRQAVSAKGLAADVTDLFDKYGIKDQMADYARNTWENTWKIDGKYYGAPGDYFAGVGIYYRRDYFQEAGLAEPQQGWTWQDLATAAKALTKGNRKGLAAQPWEMDWMLRANQFDLRTQIPAPGANWHWKYDYTRNQEEWVGISNIFRQMYNQDKSVIADTSYGDAQVNSVFGRGDAAMISGLVSFFTGSPDDPTSFSALIAKPKQKPLDELVGWVAHPNGTNGAFGNTQGSMSFAAFNPKAKSAELDKAFNLYTYMYFGQGFTDQQKALYQKTKTSARVYWTATPTQRAQAFAGIPGSFEQAWGKHFSDSVKKVLTIPPVPNVAQYLPVEQDAGPTADAYNDARSDITFTQKDLVGIFQHLQDVRSQQVASFSSSVSKDDFVRAAKRYYAAHNDFWKAHAPKFYSSTYSPFYTNVILPALK